MSCVYEHRCKVSGKSYVGKTSKTAVQRWAEHVQHSKTSGFPFHRAIRKHGADAFELIVHADGLTEADAYAMERDLIAKLGSKIPSGYNVTDGGEGNLGLRHSEEARKKISAALRQRVRAPLSEETKEKLRQFNLGKTHSEETRSKLRALAAVQHAENPISAESRQRAAEKLRGFKHGDGARQNMSRSARAKAPITDETRAKLSEALRNRKRDPETIRKIAAANTGRTFGEEARKNMSIAAIARHAKARLVKQTTESSSE